MADGKQINGRHIIAGHKVNFQFHAESSCRHPEVIPHHDDALHSITVTLPQGLYQFGVLFLLRGVQPLLKLVEDNQHFLGYSDSLPSPQGRQRLWDVEVCWKCRAVFS